MRCTIYSPVIDHQAIEVIQEVRPKWSLGLEGDVKRWRSAHFTSDQGSFTLNSMEFTAPMDAFSRIIIGTVGYFRQRDDLPEGTRKDITRFVSKTRWLVGIVGTAEGQDLSEQVFLGAAMDLTRRLGGRLFTGTELLIPTP